MDVSKLEGAELDWAVAALEGFDVQSCKRNGARAPRYSSEWELAGPIIERERIRLWFSASGVFKGDTHNGAWLARVEGQPVNEIGRTPLEAAMGAFVASRQAEGGN